MEFTFFKDDLLSALKILEPYIEKAQKEEEYTEEDENTETIIESPKTYFGDKLSVVFQENRCYLFVSTNSHQVETSFMYIFKTGKAQFCLPLTYLRQRIERTNSEIIRFEEERFFGFQVFDVELKPKKLIFEIEAFSINKLDEIRVVNPDVIPIKKEFLVSALSSLYKYSGNDRLGSFQNYVWFRIKDGICTVFANNSEILSCKKYNVDVNGEHEFGIIGKDVPKILETLKIADSKLEVLVGYDNVKINGYLPNYSVPISITNYLPSDIETSNVNHLISTNEYYFRAYIKTKELAHITKIIIGIEYNYNDIFLHFLNGHLNVHSRENLFGVFVSEFYDVAGIGEATILLDARIVNMALEDIHTDYTSIVITKYNFVYILGEGESVGGDSFRVTRGKIMSQDDYNWITSRDSDLAKYNKNYRNKYIKE